MKRLVFAIAILFWAPLAASAGERIKVMTWNLYLGADLTPVIASQSPEEFFLEAQRALAQVQANNFPERAEAIADAILRRRPHLIALQEVYDFTLQGQNGPPPFRNSLDDLLTALGPAYEVAAQNENLALSVPVPGIGLVGLVDRDVILARADVETETPPVADTGCEPSIDGCTFATLAIAQTPIGEITQKRGFSVVDAWLGSVAYRLVNTHLEVRLPDPDQPASRFLQAAQAAELIARTNALPRSKDSALLIAGDFNSGPQDRRSFVGPIEVVPPYRQFVAAGWIDLWKVAHPFRPGFTCCHDSDLLNPRPHLSERIDGVFADWLPDRTRARRVGHRRRFRTPTALWPSDHAGVIATLIDHDHDEEDFEGEDPWVAGATPPLR